MAALLLLTDSDTAGFRLVDDGATLSMADGVAGGLAVADAAAAVLMLGDEPWL